MRMEVFIILQIIAELEETKDQREGSSFVRGYPEAHRVKLQEETTNLEEQIGMVS